MAEIATIEVVDGIGVLTIDSPPVNALGIATRNAISSGVRTLASNTDVVALVLICAGRTFFVGADISEFGKPPQSPNLREVIELVEAAGKPIVAAIHGTALGGGFEVALGCHYRLAVPTAKVGLPEVKLGLLPGAGGTQRLPRLVGARAALDIMLSGQPISARDAVALGMIDVLADEHALRTDAIAFARTVAGKPLPRVRDKRDKLDEARKDLSLFEERRRQISVQSRGLMAPEFIIQAVEASVQLSFDEGMARERALFLELLESPQSAAQRYAFFAERETAKIPDIPPETPTRDIDAVAVIGAGTMGGGIAMAFANAGIRVSLIDNDEGALRRGLGVIRSNYESSARKGRITSDQVEQRMTLIAAGTALVAVKDVDLVVEAVFEDMSVKKDIFAKLDAIDTKAILASNTSFLDLDELAAETKHADRVLGLHFFSPANVMRLVEVVRGKESSAEVVATGMRLAKRIGKVPVHSRVGPGFIANRIMSKRSLQALEIVVEGPSPARIDGLLRNFGFAMGLFQMMDLVGLDVLGREEKERTLRGDLVAKGRLGQKEGGGFYDYDDARRATPSATAAEIIADFAKFKGITPGRELSDREILARLLFPVVNEGAKLLEEGIALRASDIDVAAVLGYGWPVHTGGPMYWADSIGLSDIVDQLERFELQQGEAIQTSPLLKKLAAEGSRISGA